MVENEKVSEAGSYGDIARAHYAIYFFWGEGRYLSVVSSALTGKIVCSANLPIKTTYTITEPDEPNGVSLVPLMSVS